MRSWFRKLRTTWKSHLQNKKRADGLILTMVIVFVIITLTVTVGEFYRIHLLQQDIEYQLQRSVNCAVEFAMGDSYRQDKIVNLNVTEAKREFYKYLQIDVGLDSRNRKYKNGKLSYRLYFDDVSGTINPAVFTVRGEVEAPSLFAFLTVKNIKIPFEISSTNYRVD